MNKRDWKKWFIAALIRAVKTMAQTAIAMIGTAAVMSVVDWKMVLSAVLLAGILSFLTSLKGLPEVDALDLTDSEETEEASAADLGEEYNKTAASEVPTTDEAVEFPTIENEEVVDTTAEEAKLTGNKIGNPGETESTETTQN